MSASSEQDRKIEATPNWRAINGVNILGRITDNDAFCHDGWSELFKLVVELSEMVLES
jgi:hypothetical protein